MYTLVSYPEHDNDHEIECDSCSKLFYHPRSAPGRKPKYCSPACKQRAYRLRKFIRDSRARS